MNPQVQLVLSELGLVSGGRINIEAAKEVIHGFVQAMKEDCPECALKNSDVMKIAREDPLAVIALGVEAYARVHGRKGIDGREVYRYLKTIVMPHEERALKEYTAKLV